MILGIPGLGIPLIAGYVFLISYFADLNLEEARAEADRLDPGWRLEELEARRAELPDGQNAAVTVLTAAGSLPVNWPKWPEPPAGASKLIQFPWSRLPPAEQLSSYQTQALAAVLAQADLSLRTARKVSELPDGRYPLTLMADGFSTMQSRMPAIRAIGELLSFDALRRAQAGDADGALTSCRALLNLSRSIGDEPLFISQRWRLELRWEACARIERVLAQGEASDAALEPLQRLLERDEPEPLFLYGARGDRAVWNRFFDALARKQVLPNQFQGRLASVLALGSQPAILQEGTRLVEMAKRPLEEQVVMFEHGELFPDDHIPYFARAYIRPKMQKMTADLTQGPRGQAVNQTVMRCALVAVAAERYRRAHGTWPERLDALEPTCLARVPIDPYARQPLRLRRTATGLVIYSVGPDCQDDGGKIDPVNPQARGTDVGFRLWDPALRRQAVDSSKIGAGKR
jgi:hypothetical protein